MLLAAGVLALALLIGTHAGGAGAAGGLEASKSKRGGKGSSPCTIGHRLAKRMSLTRRCKVIHADTGVRGPKGLWGPLSCESPKRVRSIGHGGDPRPQANGRPQRNRSFRRIRVIDGDNFFGERCELGFNSQSGPTALYHEGQRRITFASLRLPPEPSVNSPNWRVLLQMKQAAPYSNPTSASMFELQLRNGLWYVESEWNAVWTAPAAAARWTRFAFDVVYSQNPAVGSIKAYVDLNGDGDASDTSEQSPVIHKRTLLTEIAGGPSAIAPGGSVPSHLRAGLYQDDVYMCPPPAGCWMDLDNVQVVKG